MNETRDAATGVALTEVDRDTVLLVGHCGPDAWMLRSMVQRVLPEVRVQVVNTVRELDEHAQRSKVWLVNRVLDGHFDADTGVELIERTIGSDRFGSVVTAPADVEEPDAEDAAGAGGIALMLISDYPDAQRAARDVGAFPGFGKSAVNSERAMQRLRRAFGLAEPHEDSNAAPRRRSRDNN